MAETTKKNYFQDRVTQYWVKITGKRLVEKDLGWLNGPIGDTDIIGDKFITSIAGKENLEIERNGFSSGLLESFDDLELSDSEKKLINPEIVRFYENTSAYNFEIWSEWQGMFKPFGWLLSVIFSKRLQQLNLPLSSLDSAKGIESSIIKLVDKKSKKTKWTIWYRAQKSTTHVIYAGVYTTCTLPNRPGKFMKVIFPLPNGNCIVIMRKEVLPNGSLRLSSDGKKFGDNGFYFTVTDHKTKTWGRFVKSMHEWITVYVDEQNILRADHHLYFYGLPFMKLHYKMTKKSMKK